MTKKVFSSLGKNGEKEAKLKSAYLNDTLVMFRDYPTEVVNLGDTGDSWNSHWCIQIDEHLVQYSNTIDEARKCVQDFWAGYKAGLKAK